VTFILEGRGKIIFRLALGTLLLLGLSFLLFPSFTESVIAPIQGAFNITEDETGSWRLLVQAVAIEQGMETPVFGQGFGGYFEYYIEAIGEVMNYPPHSMYVYLFQKTGLIGLLAYIVALFALIRECSVLRKHTVRNQTSEKYRMLLKVVLVSEIFYGFAYNISLYAGFFIGMLVILKKISATRQLQ
jgi:O-antigen ligase